MRSLYSGSEENRELYESILAKETTIEKNPNVDYTQTIHDPVVGKTIILGKDALEDGSRLGLGVILSHESYRNGIDDGFEGQRLETNEAVMGHISTALGLMGIYGSGSIGAAMAGEANGFAESYKVLMSDTASEEKKMQAMTDIMNTLYSYDASEDFWRMQYDGSLLSDDSGWLRDENGRYINSDGTRSKEPIEGLTIGAKGVKDGLLNILFGGTEFTDSQKRKAEEIMTNAGLTGDWKNEVDYRYHGHKLDMNAVMRDAGRTVADVVFKAYYNNTIDYNLAKQYGINLIFTENGKWDPKKIYPETEERYRQLVNEKYGPLLNKDITPYVLNNVLQSKYLQSVKTEAGGSKTVLKISEDNPYLSMLLRQTDPVFLSSQQLNTNLYWAGCNFMTINAVSQLLTGNVFDAGQLNDIWKWAQTAPGSNGSFVMSGAYVNDANALANHVMQDVLGYKDNTLTFVQDSLVRPKETPNANFVAVREFDGGHFALNSVFNSRQTRMFSEPQKIVYDPWPYLLKTVKRSDGVYLNVR